LKIPSNIFSWYCLFTIQILCHKIRYLVKYNDTRDLYTYFGRIFLVRILVCKIHEFRAVSQGGMEGHFRELLLGHLWTLLTKNLVVNKNVRVNVIFYWTNVKFYRLYYQIIHLYSYQSILMMAFSKKGKTIGNLISCCLMIMFLWWG